MILSLLLALQAVSSQTTPNKPLPPANPVPIEASDEAGVLAPVNALFAAIAAQDAAALLAQVRPEGSVTIAEAGAAPRYMNFTQLVARLKPSNVRMQEIMPNPAVEIDGDIAMVWGNYSFRIDGKLAHCGVDHFSLVREGGRWRITDLAWSKRTTGCAE